MSASDKSKYKDNGWFVGVEPRRNPEIVVCTLLEEGEHGYLAARTAAKVIKAFVDKQHRQPSKMAKGSTSSGKVEIGAVWTTPDADDDEQKLASGHFFVDLAKKPVALAAAAPGMQ
jgi:penicillin-binding protein 2